MLPLSQTQWMAQSSLHCYLTVSCYDDPEWILALNYVSYLCEYDLSVVTLAIHVRILKNATMRQIQCLLGCREAVSDDNLIILVLYFPYLCWRDEVVLGFLASCQLVAPQVDWISEVTAKYWAGRL